jgi:N utilization substance protein B
VNDSHPFSKRTQARKMACDILYQIDITGEDLEKVLISYRGMLEEGVDDSEIPSGEIPTFSSELVRLYLSNREDIDKLIETYADRWSLERMPIVDRNLLRLGFVELLFRSDIPISVTINEYLELAKTFSTEDSGKFINGVMGKLVKDRGLEN